MGAAMDISMDATENSMDTTMGASIGDTTGTGQDWRERSIEMSRMTLALEATLAWGGGLAALVWVGF